MNERTKRLENIPGLGEDSWAVIKKFTWGEASDVKNKAMKFRISAQKQEGTIDILEAQMAELLHGVKEASFIPSGATDEQRRKIFLDLPAEAGEYLFREVDAYNSISNEEIKK